MLFDSQQENDQRKMQLLVKWNVPMELLYLFTNVLNGFSKEVTLILGLFYLWTKFFDSK